MRGRRGCSPTRVVRRSPSAPRHCPAASAAVGRRTLPGGRRRSAGCPGPARCGPTPATCRSPRASRSGPGGSAPTAAAETGHDVSAREEILARVRVPSADAGAARSPPPARTAADHGPHADLVDLFAERVEDYRATVVRCCRGRGRGAVAAALSGVAGVVVPDGFPRMAPAASGTTCARRRRRPLTAATLDARRRPSSPTASVGIAETGTIVLDHGPGQGRRALTLVPDLHVCVVRADAGRGRRTRCRRLAGPAPPAHLGQRPQRHQRHRARPGRGRPRSAHAARHPGRRALVAAPGIHAPLLIGVTRSRRPKGARP